MLPQQHVACVTLCTTRLLHCKAQLHMPSAVVTTIVGCSPLTCKHICFDCTNRQRDYANLASFLIV